MSMEQRLSRLEGRVDALGTPATKADVAEVRVELSRDIANLAEGIGNDLRAIRADVASLAETVAGLRQDVSEIRRLLERRRFWLF